jgi:trans-2,3-dihydro-3-hydroxyanthranilate isomerase
MPKRYDYVTVDVFTDRAFAGNPLAVVLGADDLRTAQLQALAREFNLSETAFPMGSTAADYRVRIFTPGQELPFAGHPSIGTAWVLADLDKIPAGPVRQECGVGILPVEVDAAGATLTGGSPSVSEPLDPAPLLAAAGLTPDDLTGVPPRHASTGLEWTFLPVREEAVARVDPDFAATRALPAMGVAPFAWDGSAAHLRAITNDGYEDPATGSATLALGVFLAAAGLVPDGETAYRVSQGPEIGRPSTLDGTVTASGGRASLVTVRGGVAPVASGEIRLP